jgi:hypothetical protein
MSEPVFTRWAAQLAAATDSPSRRALAKEIALWRPSNLSDAPGQAEAAYALARLFHAENVPSQAEKCARELVSLVRDHDENERFAADDLLAEVTGQPRPTRAATRPPARERTRAEAANAGRSAAAEVPDLAALVDSGRYDDATRAARQLGVRTPVALAWIGLHRALDARDPVLSAQMLVALRDDLRRQVTSPRRAAANEPKADAPASPLEQLLGRPVPARRLAEALENRAQERPDLIDALAAAALDHHRLIDPGVPAPFLAGVVGAALAHTPGRATRKALGRLKGTALGATFDEPGFVRLVAVLGTAPAMVASGPRRGVLRDEPDGARVWTLRVTRPDGSTVGVAAAPPEVPAELAPRLAARLIQLDPVCTLLDADPVLAAAASAAGVTLLDGGAAAVVASVLGAEPAPAAAPREAAPRPRPFAELIEAITAGADASALAGMLGPIRRRFRVFGALRPVLEGMSPERADACTLSLLEALLVVSPPEARMPEGTTFAVRAAAACPDGRVAAALRGEGATDAERAVAARFGGAGLADVLPLAVALHHAGLSLGPVHHGASGRDRRELPALADLVADPGAFWRVGVRSARGSGDVWLIGALSPEGRAIAVQLAAVTRRPYVALVAPGVDPVPGLRSTAWDAAGVDAALAEIASWSTGPSTDEDEPSE